MASLKVTEQMLVLDLGEVRRLETQDGPRLARFIAVLRDMSAICTRLGPEDGQRLHRAVGPKLIRGGIPPSEALVYSLCADPWEFDRIGQTLILPGLRIYLDGPPEFVETPLYAWVSR
ncbi:MULTISPECIES: hypothetical protein [unclassified Meiothermus]|uniref:hypothetical protein n=1 Tax=unclassified Meiothermus TaxID=370471 RepID=UPI000D7D0AD6|nr:MULTISPECIES: hypothetical protein [unclassified Meiothermus]PZA05911.1 hypothetical protein DNA98_16330 [Meiothermus sp. Pnk-1]RYM39392.1 hypothetical protein EWH23_02565 [Meiothermus sp. PNK-Is4]